MFCRKNYIRLLFLLGLFSATVLPGQTPLHSGVPVSDIGTNNNIGSANTSRNIAVNHVGTIYVVYARESQIRFTFSLNGGQSFEPSISIIDTGNSDVEPEIAVSDNGIVYIAWTEGGSIHMIRTVNSGIDFDPPVSFGIEVGNSVHMSAFGSNVYLTDRQGKKLYYNNNNGVGGFTEVDTFRTMVYSDVLTDQNGVVYVPMDDPNIVIFRSEDQGSSINEIELDPGNEQVFFSSYALSDGPCGSYIFVGGGDFEPVGTSSFLGYRIDLDTGESELLTLGENLTGEGRTLFADNQGTLIDGYKTTDSDTEGDLVIRISSDQGNTFEPPIVVASGNSHNIARSPTTDNILVVYETFGEIFLTVYDDVLKNIELREPNPPLTFCSNETFNLEFTLSGVFSPGTLFTAVLSDEFGSFANSTVIGSEITNTSGFITCTLPDNLVPSDQYRIQIESLDNCLQSNPISMNYEEASISGPNVVCISETIQLMGSNFPNPTDPWTSSDPAIATIDDNGLVTGISAGIVEISYANNQGCVTTYNVEVFGLPTVTPLVQLGQCDDDNDGIVAFNLFESASEISVNFANETFVFYPSLLDAQNDTNAISTDDALAYQNSSPSETLGVRTINGGNCVNFSEIQLTVSASAISSPGILDTTLTACDDYLDSDGNDTENNSDTDGITRFDFAFMTDTVKNFFAPSQQPFLEVNYYNNQADALAEQNPISDPSNHRNTASPFNQTIYVRVDNTLNNDCVGLAPLITLEVSPAPTTNEVDNLVACDNADDGDAFNGIVQNFDLSSQTASILGSQDPTNFTVSYHITVEDAENGINSILNTANYENITPNQQTIYVRVADNNSGCYTAHRTFDLIVTALPIANTASVLEVCDDDVDGSAQNGLSQSINLELRTAEILGSQNPDDYIVTYHASMENAELGILPLQSPYSNTTAFSQTVYVRIIDAFMNCMADISTLDLVIHPEPSLIDISEVFICDNDADGDDGNGFVQNIDLDAQIEVLLGSQDPNNFLVTFHESSLDASTGDNPIASPFSNTIVDQQTIYVRVQDLTTNCVNDDMTFDLIIESLPEFEVTSPQTLCLSQLPHLLEVENPEDVYDYEWRDQSGNTYFGPTIEIDTAGIYQVTATATSNGRCQKTHEIIVEESSIPTITNNDVIVVDGAIQNSIRINPLSLGAGTYEFALENEAGIQTPFQGDPFFENLDGGIYTILVRDSLGCGIARVLTVPVVDFPRFFTPNNDLHNDTWNLKGVSADFFANTTVKIFNRYGKLLATVDLHGPGWDGTYNGELLPSDDYWFIVSMMNSDQTLKEYKGNFALLRK